MEEITTNKGEDDMFQYDSPIMSVLNKITDIIILNICTLICCLPIVTIGASLTAAHYTALKMHRDTDNYVLRNFFRSFRQNLKQSTLIWLLWCVLTFLFITSYRIYGQIEGMMSILQGCITAILIFWMMLTLWLFPLQARFVNSIRSFFVQAFVLACKHLFRTILMLLVTAGGSLMWFVGARFFWLPILCGFSVPIYLCAMIYNRVFLGLEEKILGVPETEHEEKNEE